MGSSEFANARQVALLEASGGEVTGFTTGNTGVDLELWSEAGAEFNEFLGAVDDARFDAAGVMPREVQDALVRQGRAIVDLVASVPNAVVEIDAARPFQ